MNKKDQAKTVSAFSGIPEAHFVISKSKVLEEYNKLADLGFDISFSAKTNPDVTHILEEETDCLFSIHSVEGLPWVDDMSRAIFLVQAWCDAEIENLLHRGINKFVVENETDLKVLVDYMDIATKEGSNVPNVDLQLRMKLKEHSLFTGRYYVFGMNAAQVNEWIPQLRSKQWLGKLGVHFHKKTQNTSEWSYHKEIEQTLSDEVFDALDVINIGGGIPITYRNSNNFKINTIIEKIKEFGEWLKKRGISMMLEPGRPIAGPAGELHAYVLGVDEQTVFVNCSIYNTALDSILVPFKLMVKGEKEDGKRFIIKGHTPCSQDMFRYDVKIDRPKIGDKIVFLNAGAYNFSSDFCNLQPLKTKIVE